MYRLYWVKSYDKKWLNLAKLELTGLHSQGVYIIWHGGPHPRIIRIGQGDLAQRLAAHRLNPQIMRYQEFGPIMVTWSEIDDENIRQGIEVHLVRQLNPLIRDKLPEVYPLRATTPFT